MVSNCELSSCLCLFAIVRCVVAMIFMTHIMSMLEKHAEIPNKRDQIARNVEKVIRDETRVQFERLDSTRKVLFIVGCKSMLMFYTSLSSLSPSSFVYFKCNAFTSMNIERRKNQPNKQLAKIARLTQRMQKKQ